MTSDLSMIRHRFDTPEIQEWLLSNGTREDVIDWLVWNDGNGVYTDEDSRAEGYRPLTLESARDTMRAILERELGLAQ